MYYGGRRRGLIVAIVIIVLVIILGIGGVFAYLTTDMFKSNQVLFFKYAGQALKNMEYVENTQLTAIENLKKQMPYTVDGSLEIEAEGELESLSKIGLDIELKENKLEEKAYMKADLLHDNQKIFTLEYANSNNIYALKSDEIVTAFIGIENENLKVLAQKFGITDTTNIPDSIDTTNLRDKIVISDEEKAHITNTYSAVLMQSIPKDAFTKEKDLSAMKKDIAYITTAYRLTLNAQELKQIEIALLETLKQDSITLNLIATNAKALGLDEDYTHVNSITNIIDELITEINNEEDISDAGISIMIYVDKGQVVLTEIIARNEIKYTIYGDINGNANERYLLIENLGIDGEFNKIEVQQIETRSDEQSTNNIIVNLDDTRSINIDLTNIGGVAQNNLNTTCQIDISMEDDEISAIYEQEINFEEIDDIIELSRNNTAVLNDYTKEQLGVLIQSIYNRIAVVLNQKMQLVNINQNIGTNNIMTNNIGTQGINQNINLQDKLSKMQNTTINIEKSDIRTQDSGVEPYGVFVIMLSYDTESPEFGFKSPTGKLYYTDCKTNIEPKNNEFGVSTSRLWTSVSLPAEEGVWTMYYDKKSNASIDYSIVNAN